MEKRRMTIIAIVICMLALAVILTLILINRKPNKANTNGVTNTANANQAAPGNTNVPRQLTEEELARNEVVRISTIFSERYGTYTNVFSKNNLPSIETIITTPFKDRISASFSSSATITADLVELTTQVLNSRIDQFTLKQSAAVTVATLRRQTNAKNETNAVSQDISLRLVYTDSAWKVDSAQWGKAAPLTQTP